MPASLLQQIHAGDALGRRHNGRYTLQASSSYSRANLDWSSEEMLSCPTLSSPGAALLTGVLSTLLPLRRLRRSTKNSTTAARAANAAIPPTRPAMTALRLDDGPLCGGGDRLDVEPPCDEGVRLDDRPPCGKEAGLDDGPPCIDGVRVDNGPPCGAGAGLGDGAPCGEGTGLDDGPPRGGGVDWIAGLAETLHCLPLRNCIAAALPLPVFCSIVSPGGIPPHKPGLPAHSQIAFG